MGVTITASFGLDFTALAFNQVFVGFSSAKITTTQVDVDWSADGQSYRTTFHGSGLSATPQGIATGGTVTSYRQYILEGEDSTPVELWRAEGLSVSAVDLQKPFLTPSSADDLAMLQSIMAGNDRIVGSDQKDVLFGFGGDDNMNGGGGIDTLNGGTGNDTYFVDDQDKVIEAKGGGKDTVIVSGVTYPYSYTLAAGQEIEVLRNGQGGFLALTGNEFANSIFGGTGTDTLNGMAGNDILDGGTGADFMIGGAGNDTYYVDNANDKVTEAKGGGKDTVFALGNYTLQAGQEIEFLRSANDGSSKVLTGNEFDNSIFGNGGVSVLDGAGGNDHLYGMALSDTLNGGAGNDLLDGGTGQDEMTGGTGNDEFIVDFSTDKAFEAPGGGKDTVFASVSYTLLANAEIEFLRNKAAAGTGLSLTGNTFDNSIFGNAGADTLDGAGGNDHLYGLAGIDHLTGGTGNDTLDGGTGADDMAGGAGIDEYIVDNAADTVSEAAGGGTDTVFASISFTLQAGQEIENLRNNAAAGTGLSLTGNGLDNSIFGNAGADTLDGAGGNDHLYGLAGIDHLTGGTGNDFLDGGAGADDMTGGAGTDEYIVDNAADKVTEAAGGGTDTVFASVSYTLKAGQEIENLRNNAGATGLTLTGNAFDNSIIGGTGNDTLNGGTGNDRLTGGAGQDLYLFNSALNAATNLDRLTDFNVADDTIQLSHSVFTAAGGAGTLAAAAFVTAAAALDADDRIIYNSSTGALLYDADGNGAGAAVKFATVTGGLALSRNDFQIV